MTYKQALDFLYARLPVFHRIGAAAYKPGLDNTYALANALGNPQNSLTCIHVAGTNGKGSTAHMLASVFMEMGWKTGLYTSPHLKDFGERIKVNGKNISTRYVIDFVQHHKGLIETIKPSFFELTCMMAFRYFADKKTDIVIVETGMGGRLDSTNIIYPELSVITNISKDHTQFLGNTLEKIAFEKAGIIKPGVPVVIGEATGKVKQVFKRTAQELDCPIAWAQDTRVPANMVSELKGSYQPLNIRTVLTAVEVLNHSGYKIPFNIARKGIARVVTNTGLKGRWQTLSISPRVICDIGHNEAGIREVIKNLRHEKYKQLHVVLGVVNDKDVRSMLKQLPKTAKYYFTNAQIPRALPASELQQTAKGFKLKGDTYSTVKKALAAAKKNAAKGDLIFVGGSAFVVAEVV